MARETVLLYAKNHRRARKSVKLEELPDGEYALRLLPYRWPRFPLVDRDEIPERAREWDYEGEVVIEGPFGFFKKYKDMLEQLMEGRKWH